MTFGTDPRWAYEHDAYYRALVNAIRGAIRDLKLTPGECRSAAKLACVLESKYPDAVVDP